MNKSRIIALVVIVAIIGVGVWQYSTEQLKKQQSGMTAENFWKGLDESKRKSLGGTIFNDECVKQAVASMGQEQANMYCKCAYDKLETLYGTEMYTQKFSDRIQSLGFTEDETTLLLNCYMASIE